MFDNPDKSDYPPIRRIPFAISGKTPPAPHRSPFTKWTDSGKRALSRRLKNLYGITLEEYDALLLAQGGACAICRHHAEAPRNLHVDHCHTMGKVRGLLCTHCNRGIGGFKDNPEWCESAARYLRADHQ